MVLINTSAGTITVDCTTSERHQAEVEVTDSPVEKGTSVTDHARAKPEGLTLEGLITSTVTKQPERTVTFGAFDFKSTSVDDPARVENALAQLRHLKDNAELVSVVTSIRRYDDMILTSLETPVDPRTGRALKFTASFRQIRVVTTQRVAIKRAEPKLKPEEKKGAAPPVPPKNISLAASAQDKAKAITTATKEYAAKHPNASLQEKLAAGLSAVGL